MRLIVKEEMLGFTEGKTYKALHDKVNKIFYIKNDFGCVTAVSESYAEYFFEKCKPSVTIHREVKKVIKLMRFLVNNDGDLRLTVSEDFTVSEGNTFLGCLQMEKNCMNDDFNINRKNGAPVYYANTPNELFHMIMEAIDKKDIEQIQAYNSKKWNE